MTIKLSEETRRAAVDAITRDYSRPYAHPLLRRIAGALHPATIYTCANVTSVGLHTSEYYEGGYCRCCRSLRDQDAADEFYAEMKKHLAERAPA